MSKTSLFLACVSLSSLLGWCIDAPARAGETTTGDGATSQPWVVVGDDGKLRYHTTNNGDRIVDFSYAGYGGGGVALPTVPVQKELTPSGKDDTSAIQSAINAVAALPLKDGFRGAVLLRPGIYHCSDPIKLSQDGIVLRGSGTAQDGTVIEMTGDRHVCIAIAGDRLQSGKEETASTFPISDAYVPSGALSLSVKDAKGLTVGDVVHVHRAATEKWIHFMGMDTLVRDGKPQTWMKPNAPITAERTIRAIEGNRITFDVPLTDAIDAQFLGRAVATVVKVTEPKRLMQCGIESLRIESPPPTGTLTAKNNISATLDNCEDCWISNVAMHDTLGNVDVGPRGRRITMERVDAVHTATVAKGAGYPADFSIRGSQVLIDRCSSSGDGSFYVATLNTSATLNVALNCNFKGKGAIQPHMHWSTALLIDSCKLPEGRIEFINRNTAGSGHGWAMGWAVAWNCTAKDFLIELPPGAMNWCIGGIGELKKGSAKVCFSAHGAPVLPMSLYLAQLRERLGEGALKNIGY